MLNLFSASATRRPMRLRHHNLTRLSWNSTNSTPFARSCRSSVGFGRSRRIADLRGCPSGWCSARRSCALAAKLCPRLAPGLTATCCPSSRRETAVAGRPGRSRPETTSRSSFCPIGSRFSLHSLGRMGGRGASPHIRKCIKGAAKKIGWPGNLAPSSLGQ